MLIFRAWATCVLTYTHSIHGIHAWWKRVVKTKMAVTDRKYSAMTAVYTIFTSAMSKSTSFWRKISICSLNFSLTTFCPAPLEYSEAVWQIDPAKSAPPSWATPLARSHAAWFILVVWNKIFKKVGWVLFFGGGGECFFLRGWGYGFKNSVVQKNLSGDQFRFLGNCPPTPPLSQHFALSQKW